MSTIISLLICVVLYNLNPKINGEPGLIATDNFYPVSGSKYEMISTESDYNKYMMLKIRNVGPDDFRSYKCVAQNSLGGTDGDIKLDGKSFSDNNEGITYIREIIRQREIRWRRITLKAIFEVNFMHRKVSSESCKVVVYLGSIIPSRRLRANGEIIGFQ